jgi:peptidoglycan/LPS O-acetylase OafA/YrhL
LYVIFPLLLLTRRRMGPVPVLVAVTLPVVVVGLLDPGVSTVERAMGLTPQFAPLFAAGLVAAGVVATSDRIRRLPWHWLAALAAAPVVLLVVLKGSVWTVNHYYWVDLAIGPAIALLLAAVATRRPAPLVRLLGTRPLRSLGTFSYSLYLIHAPIVVAISRKVVAPHVAPGLPAFWVTLALAVPVSVVTARLFAAVFEIPFQRHRSWSALRAAAHRRLVDEAQDAVPRGAEARPQPERPGQRVGRGEVDRDPLIPVVVCPVQSGIDESAAHASPADVGQGGGRPDVWLTARAQPRNG